MNKVTRKYSRSKTFEGSLPSNLYEEMTADNKRRGCRDVIADRTRSLAECPICTYPHSVSANKKANWITCPVPTCRRSFCFKCCVSNSPNSKEWGEAMFQRPTTYVVRCLSCHQFIDIYTGEHRANTIPGVNGVHTRSGAGL